VSEPKPTPRRFRGLPLAVVDRGRVVPVAASLWSRLLGLALLDPADAPDGLLIPGCRSVHTIGMRFALDLRFLDAQGLVVSERRALGSGRFARDRRARSVLELPAGEGTA
jgi:hypothetical protein